ncbi:MULTISPECIES: carbon-nitrogen hydrolase family protein [Streptomyces]|uniref:carbon-nitrogen hydrolase family protein n=1 Tax=Streptomyces TaxID=1883 RepID=UPI000690758C|nr:MULTISPECIES: carbon-nitrogen hydrolase family protein [Streptomyces]
MSRILGVALAQVAPVTGDPQATFAKFSREVRSLKALSPSIDLVVFPELYLSAFGSFDARHPAGYLDRLAEPIPGPTTDAVCRLAVETGLWIVPGSIPERSAKGVHNTAVAISPQGEVVASYRKIFPWMPYETSVPGDTYVTFDIPQVGRFGLAICYDGWVPEIFRTLAWMGAEVIIQPTYTRTSDREQELVLARANAITNQVYVLNPNIGGLFGTGRSIATDPEGRVLAQGGAGEEFLTFHLDLDLVATTREHGTLGLNPLWKQLRDAPPPFPPASEGYDKGPIMTGLGPLHPARAGSTGA